MGAPIHGHRALQPNVVQQPQQQEGGMLQNAEPQPQIRQGRVDDACCRDMRCVKAMVYLVSAALIAVDVLAFLSSAGIKPSGPKALRDFSEKVGQHDIKNILLMPVMIAVVISLLLYRNCYRSLSYGDDDVADFPPEPQQVGDDEAAVLLVAPVAGNENHPLVARAEEVELNHLVVPAVLNFEIEGRDQSGELVTEV